MPVIILTKSDLCDDLENKLSEVSSVAFGIDVLVTTSTEENGYKDIKVYKDLSGNDRVVTAGKE